MDTPKKSLGQHWLDDELTLQSIADSVNVSSSDTILEIGPGQGTLTSVLVERAEKVIAVELDDYLVRALPRRVPAPNLEIIHKDILSFDFASLSKNYKVVANIPYYLTSNLIRVLSESSNPPLAAALLVQKEVAERAAAKPGDMSLLSVTAQFYWQVELGPIVKAEMFTPPPKVDSQVLILNRRPNVLYDVEPKEFFRLAKASFSQRRKTLLNSLSAGLGMTRDETKALCERANIDSHRRPQSLSLEEWHTIYKFYA